MKKRFLSLVLVLVLLCSFAIMSFAFSDVFDGHWAKDYIDMASGARIVNGYEDGSFKPDNQLTAGEFIKMVACVMDRYYEPVYNNGEHWAYQYVKLLANNIDGFNVSQYDEARELDSIISRGDMSVILAIAYATKNEFDIRYDIGDGVLIVFKDLNDIPEDKKPYINLCVIFELLNGFEDRTFRANEGLTRAQACKVICKLLYE